MSVGFVETDNHYGLYNGTDGYKEKLHNWLTVTQYHFYSQYSLNNNRDGRWLVNNDQVEDFW